MNKNQKRTLATLAALAITLAIVNASVFVYYQLNISLTSSKPAVYFVAGNNANQNDISTEQAIKLM